MELLSIKCYFHVKQMVDIKGWILKELFNNRVIKLQLPLK